MEYEIIIRMEHIAYFLFLLAMMLDKRAGMLTMLAIFVVGNLLRYVADNPRYGVINIPIIPKHHVESGVKDE